MNKKILYITIGISIIIIILAIFLLLVKTNLQTTTKENHLEKEDTEIKISSVDASSEKNQIIEEFLNVFVKYYGQEETNRLQNSIENEITLYRQNNPGEYVFPDSGIELIQKCINIINITISEEEKRIISDMLDIIDLSSVKDEKIINELINLGIDIDSAYY